jgi:hypothetical protein
MFDPHELKLPKSFSTNALRNSIAKNKTPPLLSRNGVSDGSEHGTLTDGKMSIGLLGGHIGGFKGLSGKRQEKSRRK